MFNNPEKDTWDIPNWLSRSVLAVAFTLFASLIAIYVQTGHLATLASDSINYLVMAAGFSPWQTIPETLLSHLPNQDYPPLFGLLLGLSGMHRTLDQAHLFTASLLIPGLLIYYLFACRVLKHRGLALGMVLLVMILPSTWENALGILSETLYLLLSMLLLYLAGSTMQTWKSLFASVLLLTLLLHTRSIGIAMVLALSLQEGIRQQKTTRRLIRVGLLLGGPVLIVWLVRQWLSAAVPGQYFAQLSQLIEADMAIFGYISEQARFFFENWQTALLRYWTDDLPLSFNVGVLCLAVAIVGLGWRLWLNTADGWYVLIYTSIVLVWPWSGQMYRFLYPMLGLYLLHAVGVANELGMRCFPKHPRAAAVILQLLLLAAILPSVFFTGQRYLLGQTENLSGFMDYYREVDIYKARYKAAEQATIIADMRELPKRVPIDQTVLYFQPELISYFSGRNALQLPFGLKRADYLALIKTTQARYVYLSRLIPKHSRESISGLDLLPIFLEHGNLLWLHFNPVSQVPVSALVELKKNEL